MYSNTGYLHNTDIEIEDTAHPLSIASCGVYRLINQPMMPTLRPEGRRDHQLLYVSAGKAFFCLEGRLQEVNAGHMTSAESSINRPAAPLPSTAESSSDHDLKTALAPVGL